MTFTAVGRGLHKHQTNRWRGSFDGTGAVKQWLPRTPAMAATLTDHVWSLREVLLFRVPLWPQDPVN
jgi:hypothetical protein